MVDTLYTDFVEGIATILESDLSFADDLADVNRGETLTLFDQPVIDVVFVVSEPRILNRAKDRITLEANIIYRHAIPDELENRDVLLKRMAEIEDVMAKNIEVGGYVLYSEIVESNSIVREIDNLLVGMGIIQFRGVKDKDRVRVLP